MKYYLYNPLANNGIKSHIPEGAQLIDASKTDYTEFFAGLKEDDEVVLIGGDGTINYLINHVDNIVGIKEASGDISQIAQIAQLTNGELELYSGNDDQTTAFMALGAKGVVSVLSNIMPLEAHNIAQAALDGDFKKSAELQIKYLEMCQTLFCDVNPIPVKAALNMMGFDAGECRMPLYHLSEANYKKLEKCMRKYGLIK